MECLWKLHGKQSALVVSTISATEDVRFGYSMLTNLDILRVKNRQFIPADLIILAYSEAQGMCYIETASLDG